MEALIYVKTPGDTSGDYFFILIYSLFWRNEKSRFTESCSYFLENYQDSLDLCMFTRSLLYIVQGEYIESLRVLEEIGAKHSGDQLPFIKLIKSCAFVGQGQYDEAKLLLSYSTNPLSLEGTLLVVRILRAQFSYGEV